MGANNLSEALSTVVGHAESAGHEIMNSIEFTDYNGKECRGYTVREPMGSDCLLYGPTEGGHLHVTGHFNIVGHLTGIVSEDELEQYADTGIAYREYEDEPIETVGARALLDSMEQDQLNDAASQVREIMNVPKTVVEVQYTQHDSPSWFLVHSKLFPYHDSYNIQDYHSATSLVTTLRYKGMEAFLEMVDFPGVDSEVSTSEAKPHTREQTRGFH